MHRPVRQVGSNRFAACRARGGFTLVEMVMVVIILGLVAVAVMTVGYFSLRQGEELKSDARMLAGFLEHVRSQAALSGKVYIIEYGLSEDDELGQQYYATYLEGEDETETAANRDKATRFRLSAHRTTMGESSYRQSIEIDRLAFGDGSTENSGEVTIRVTPTGGAHWHYVYLRNEDDEFYTIEVNPFTGLGSIHEGEVKPEEPERLR